MAGNLRGAGRPFNTYPTLIRNFSTARQYIAEMMFGKSFRQPAWKAPRRLGVTAIVLTATAALWAAPDPRIAQVERDIRPVDRVGNPTGSAKSLSARMAELKVPGISVAVFDHSEIIWAKAYGLRNVARGQAVDTDTLFQAASLSKPVSAVAMFRLVEQGRLDIDRDVNSLQTAWKVPSFGPMTPPITLRQIVSHMSGLGVHGFGGYTPGAPLPSLVQILDGQRPANSPPVRPEAAPGEREIYSGGGFVLLQLIMQEITGRPFESVMQELVLQPVGMAHSTFAQPLPARQMADVAMGYREDGEMVDGGFHVYPEQSAAGLWTTASDLARFLLAVGHSRRGESGGLLKRSTATEMLTRVPKGGGLGFGLSGSQGTERYRHSGGNAGYGCFMVAFTRVGRGVVVLTNSDNGTPLIQELLSALSRQYDWPSMMVGAP